MRELPPGLDNLSAAQQLRIDEVCDRFECAWRNAAEPRIEDYLIGAPQELQNALLCELILLDVHYRDGAGAKPSTAIYLARYPELDEGWLGEALTAYQTQEPGGQTSRAGPVTVAETPTRPTTPPRSFGDYELLEEIARGGMGVVYKARQISLNRLVALKFILSGELASEGELRRFQVEAEAAASLDHPHIVPVYEVGTHAGRRYLALKLVEGGSLKQRCDEFALPAAGPASATRVVSLTETRCRQERIARLLITVARAVHYAHQRGILHRDLKPSNILLDESGSPFVTDFGLAKHLRHAPDSTATDGIVGTPLYMAPEIASGQSKNVSTAIDIYALGVILYELLTGAPPFQAEAPLQILERVTRSEPTLPRKLQPAVQRDLETICMKCLHKAPQDRYASAEELAQDLEHFERGEPIRARPASWRERSWRWCRRNPAVAGLLSALAVVVGAGLAAVLWSWRDAVTAQQTATKALGDLSQQKTLAEQAAETAKEHAAKATQARRETEAANQQLQEELHRTALARYALTITLAFQKIREGELAGAEELLEECPRDLVGWEYGYLKGLCRPQTIELRGHTDMVTAITFSSDSRLLATASRDQTIRIWDVAARKQVGMVTPANPVGDRVAFNHDASRIAALDADGAVSVLETSSGKILWTAKPFKAYHTALHFSPDGAQVLASGQGGWWKRWQAATGEAIPTFFVSKDGVRRPIEALGVEAAVSPDGVHAALLLSPHGPVELWNIAEGHVSASLPLTTDHCDYAPLTLRFTPSGNQFFLMRYVKSPVRGQFRERIAYDLGTRQWTGRIDGQLGVAHTTHGGQALVLPDPGLLEVWDVPSNRRRLRLGLSGRGHADISPDGQYAVAATSDHVVHLIRTLPELTRTAAAVPRPPARPGELTTAVVLEKLGDGAKSQYVIAIKDKASRQIVQRLVGHSEQPKLVRMAPDVKLLASVQPGNAPSISIWDIQSAARIHELKGHSAALRSLTFHANDQLVSTDTEGVICLWNPAAGRLIHRLVGHKGVVSKVAFSQDHSMLASICRGEQSVRLWDLKTGQEAHCLVHRGDIEDVAISPSGPWVATRSDDGLSMWDSRSGRLLYARARRADNVVFTPDGRRVAVAEPNDEVITILDSASGQELLALPYTAGALAFSADGKHLEAISSKSRTEWRGSTVALPLWRADRFGNLLAVTAHDVLCEGNSPNLRSWDLRTGKRAPDPVGALGGFRELAVSKDGRLLAVGSEKKMPPLNRRHGKLYVTDARTGEQLLAVNGLRGSPFGLTFSADATKLGALHRGTRNVLSASVWDLTRGAVSRLPGDSRNTNRAFSPNLDLVVQRVDNTIWLADLASGAGLMPLADDSRSQHYVFSPDSRHLASAYKSQSGRQPIRVWDVETLEQIASFPGAAPLAFHPSGRFLACAGADDTLELWDLSSASKLASFRAHVRTIEQLIFNADGSLLVSAAADRVVKVWDMSPWLPRSNPTQEHPPVVAGRNSAECWRKRGAGHEARKQDDKALECYTEAVRLDPECFMALWARARLNRRLGRWAEAARDFDRAIRLEPKDALLAGLRDCLKAAATPRPFRVLIADLGGNKRKPHEFYYGSVVDRLRDLGFEVVVVPFRDFDPNMAAKNDVLFLPTNWAWSRERYAHFESKKDDFHAFVKNGGGLVVCQPHPFNQSTPALLPYPITFRAAYDGSDTKRLNLAKDAHFLTRGLRDADMPFPRDQVVRIDENYQVLAVQEKTQWPSLMVCTYGAGRVVVQTSNESHVDVPVTDEMLRRIVVWAAGRE